jgi:hypothetical protein
MVAPCESACLHLVHPSAFYLLISATQSAAVSTCSTSRASS